MRIDFPGLQAFLASRSVAAFGRAAAHLNLSQTALSTASELEEDLGLQLLAAPRGRWRLTPAGLELLPTARRDDRGISDSIDLYGRRGRQAAGAHRAGLAATLAAYHLPRVLKESIALHPLSIKIHAIGRRDRPLCSPARPIRRHPYRHEYLGSRGHAADQGAICAAVHQGQCVRAAQVRVMVASRRCRR